MGQPLCTKKWYAKLQLCVPFYLGVAHGATPTQYYCRPINDSIVAGFAATLEVGSKMAVIRRFTRGEAPVVVQPPA
jgi:hypothetical protein